MELLAALRKHILTSPLGVKADNLVTFAKDGEIVSHQGDTNHHFSIRYDANIIVVDYGKAPDMLFYIVLNWLKANNANHQTNAIRFNADIIDHKKTDVEIIVPLEELVGANEVEGGIQLVHNGIVPIDTVPLSAENWELYLPAEEDPVATWLSQGE